jgi:hypothetical protein
MEKCSEGRDEHERSREVRRGNEVPYPMLNEGTKGE